MSRGQNLFSCARSYSNFASFAAIELRDDILLDGLPEVVPDRLHSSGHFGAEQHAFISRQRTGDREGLM
jgi:hypothetical protein